MIYISVHGFGCATRMGDSEGNGGPSRNGKAGARKPLWSRGRCQDETRVQLYFRLTVPATVKNVGVIEPPSIVRKQAG